MRIFLVLFTAILLSSCGEKPKARKSIEVKASEFYLTFDDQKLTVFETGKHEVDSTVKSFFIQKEDTLRIESFEVLDSKANAMLCEATVVYSLERSNLDNIINEREWVSDIENYKASFLYVPVRAEIRARVGEQELENLLKPHFISKINIEASIRKRLGSFMNLKALDVRIQRKS